MSMAAGLWEDAQEGGRDKAGKVSLSLKPLNLKH